MHLKLLILITLLKTCLCKDDEEGQLIPIEDESTDDSLSENDNDLIINDEAEKNEAVKTSRLGVSDALGSEVLFDGDNSDIDDFDFGEEELDEEEDIDINANHIKPVDWVVILENYIAVLNNERTDETNKRKILKAKILKVLEEELKEREEDDFKDDEEEKLPCANLEFSLLNSIQSLPVEKQKTVFDVDKDGIPDFDFIDINKEEDGNE